MWIGWIELDLLLGDVHSLKGKRSIVRPLVSDVKRKYSVSAAEVDAQDLYRRTVIGVGLVADSRAHIVEVLDAVEQFVAYRPELELLSARRRIVSSADD